MCVLVICTCMYVRTYEYACVDIWVYIYAHTYIYIGILFGTDLGAPTQERRFDISHMCMWQKIIACTWCFRLPRVVLTCWCFRLPRVVCASVSIWANVYASHALMHAGVWVRNKQLHTHQHTRYTHTQKHIHKYTREQTPTAAFTPVTYVLCSHFCSQICLTPRGRGRFVNDRVPQMHPLCTTLTQLKYTHTDTMSLSLLPKKQTTPQLSVC